MDGQAAEFKDKHALSELWEPCRKKLEEIWPEEPSTTWNAVEQLVREFDTIDPDGMQFRYPVGTKKAGRRPSLVTLDRLGIRNLRTKMQTLANFFDGHLDGIHVYAQNQSSVV